MPRQKPPQTAELEGSILSKPAPPPPTPPNNTPPTQTPENSVSKYKCYCGFEPSASGKDAYKSSNLKRHQESKACRRYSPYKRPEPREPVYCRFPGCGKKYGRSDNLRAHQKNKEHFLEYKMRPPPPVQFFQAEAAVMRETLERRRYQGLEISDADESVWI